MLRFLKRINEDFFDGFLFFKFFRYVFCMGLDLGFLVRRVRNVRIIVYVLEICV